MRCSLVGDKQAPNECLRKRDIVIIDTFMPNTKQTRFLTGNEMKLNKSVVHSMNLTSVRSAL